MSRFSFILAFLLTACSGAEKDYKYQIASDVYQTLNIAFKPHADSLKMMVRDWPLVHLHKQWLKDHPSADNLPQEFFIPVLNKEEYKILREHLSKDEIESVAKENFLQNSRFDIKCIGKMDYEVKGGQESEYFVRLESDDLIKIRYNLKKLYLHKGGVEELFYPTTYNPYIVFASTKPGLIPSGWKAKDNCIEPLGITEPF